MTLLRTPWNCCRALTCNFSISCIVPICEILFPEPIEEAEVDPELTEQETEGIAFFNLKS